MPVYWRVSHQAFLKKVKSNFFADLAGLADDSITLPALVDRIIHHWHLTEVRW